MGGSSGGCLLIMVILPAVRQLDCLLILGDTLLYDGPGQGAQLVRSLCLLSGIPSSGLHVHIHSVHSCLMLGGCCGSSTGPQAAAICRSGLPLGLLCRAGALILGQIVPRAQRPAVGHILGQRFGGRVGAGGLVDVDEVPVCGVVQL